MQIMKKSNLEAWKKTKEIGPKGVIELLKSKGLTGRGGAGFPTGIKWEMVAHEISKEKYLICNADEGEPGTFKDKLIIENNPELIIEGIIIGAETIGAKQAFIYLRGEYDYLESHLKQVIADLLKKTKADLKIDIVEGAGAYVCGDETAICESIQGNRGQPRIKPPFPTVQGLWGKPTVINNVETLANVPLAILYEDWNPRLRLYSLSGDVNKPAVYEVEMGIKACDLVNMAEPKNPIKAIYFGCFGGCMPNCDVPLDPTEVCGKECIHGAGTIICVDNTRSIVDVATNIAKFYEFESCGKCTPCREGTMRILGILENISMGKATLKDIDTMQELAEVIKETAFCGLGQTATQHLLTALKYFRNEFEEKCKSE